MRDTEIKSNLREDIRQELGKTLGDSYKDLMEEVGYELHSRIYDNIWETSALGNGGLYNDVDVKLAVQRVIVDNIIDGIM